MSNPGKGGSATGPDVYATYRDGSGNLDIGMVLVPKDGTETDLGTAILAKLSDPATQATLAALLAANHADLAAILAKLTNDPATQTTLAAILAKLIAAPATEAKQDSSITQETATATVLGLTTDAAVITDANGTISGKLRGLVKRWADALGAGNAAAALRTTLASDDPAVATLGATTGAAVTTDANGTIQQYLRGLIKLIGAKITVGIDQTTPGTTNKVAVTTQTEHWAAGSLVGLTWATAGFSTEVNSVISGNAILAANALNNSSALDIFADLSISLGSITPGAGAPYIGLYLYPLNQDGTTYGDGRFITSAAGPPPSQYFVGSIPCIASTSGVIIGMLRGVVLPPGQWKFVLYNLAGATLASSANTIQCRTYNRAVS